MLDNERMKKEADKICEDYNIGLYSKKGARIIEASKKHLLIMVERNVKEREESLAVLSSILKNILSGQYEYEPWGVTVQTADKPIYKKLAVRSLMCAMNLLAEGINLPEDLKRTLILSEADLERCGSNTNLNNGQWVGWEGGKTESSIKHCDK